ncbi:PEP-CTERM sorting domain-containing protein [Dapis sp. BLCC M126]|uniref:PEP-CTERM sorting domain-containing protein n=1 Tax=Dapis sp. BLCC M126 TaxID=3400189 RepID=UPI003CF7EAB3
MKNLIFTALVSAPLAVSTVFNPGVANATTLSGGFQFDGSDQVDLGEFVIPATTVQFNDQELDFVTDPSGLDPKISVKLAQEDFGFANNSMADIFDLTGLNATDGSETTFNAAQEFIALNDGTVLFLESVSDFTFIDNTDSTDVNLGFMGYFLKDGMETDATGSITFQVQQSLQEVQNAVMDNQLLDAAFSGTVATSEAVPEPSTMLGLGLVAAASAFGLKKKNS